MIDKWIPRSIGDLVRLEGRLDEWTVQEVFTASSAGAPPVFRVISRGGRVALVKVPVALLQHAGQLRDLVTKNRGWTSADAESRTAIDPYKTVLIELLEAHNVSYASLDRALGYRSGGVRWWLSSHGYGKMSPSQKRYKGPRTR